MLISVYIVFNLPAQLVAPLDRDPEHLLVAPLEHLLVAPLDADLLDRPAAVAAPPPHDKQK